MESAMQPRGEPSAWSASTPDSTVPLTRFSATVASPAGLMAVSDTAWDYREAGRAKAASAAVDRFYREYDVSILGPRIISFLPIREVAIRCKG